MGYTTYGSVFGGFCILTGLVFLFGILFSGRLIVIRYIVWMISFSLLILTVWIAVKHATMISEHESRLGGTFCLDVNSSICDSNTLQNYKGLRLEVNLDNTFQFSRESSFFPSSQGHWNYLEDGDFAFVQVEFYNSNRKVFAHPDSTKWVFTSIDSETILEGQELIFTRSNNNCVGE